MSEPPAIVVDTNSGVAPWRQVRDQILALVTSGALPVGEALPPIRQLARDLGLASGTVARAYRELESDGVLSTARRLGTVVAAVPEPPDPLAALRAAAQEYAARAAAFGVDAETAASVVLAALAPNRGSMPG